MTQRLSAELQLAAAQGYSPPLLIMTDQEGGDVVRLAEDLPGFQAEAVDAAVDLTRLSRGAEELEPDMDDDVAADVGALRPLLQAFAESYVLIGLARSWEEARDEPLVSPGFISDT